MADSKQEKKWSKSWKKDLELWLLDYNQEGSQTIDHYSLLGFTKAYGDCKKKL